jgi:Mn2+/Fe2+ NRAMP family transporter
MTPEPVSPRTPARASRWQHFLAVFGPGLVVMLADTDAGSIITAAQSGAQWGYKLLAAQLILIPILYVVQELTIRLGLVTGRGHGELIRETFGLPWALLSIGTMTIACVGALLTEFSGLTGVGLLFGIPAWLTMLLAGGGLIAIVWTGSYRSVERVAISVGLFELVFVVVAWCAHPSSEMMLVGMTHPALGNSSYLYLLAANIGAVIMPWMIFYQQSAVVDKGLKATDLSPARWDTLVGSVITQIVMAAVLVVTAATIGTSNPNTPLDTVQQIANAITPFLGTFNGRILFAMGMIGASLVSAIVVSLTAAWGVGEVFGFKRSLEHRPQEAPWFYGIFMFCVALAAVIVASNVNLVAMSVAVQVMNALLLPVVLGFLYALACRALPLQYRLWGRYKTITLFIVIITSCLGVYGAISGLLSA